MSDESTDEQADLAEIEGIVRGEDGLLRAKMMRSANAGRIPDEYR